MAGRERGKRRRARRVSQGGIPGRGTAPPGALPKQPILRRGADVDPARGVLPGDAHRAHEAIWAGLVSALALLGGPRTRHAPFPPYPVIGEAERRAGPGVLHEGRLSTFIAGPGEQVLGGPPVRHFEQGVGEFHAPRLAPAFHSATAPLPAGATRCGSAPG